MRLRDKSGNLHTLSNKRSGDIVIKDAMYNEVYRSSVKFNEYGSFFLEFKTTDTAPTGLYNIDFSMTNGDIEWNIKNDNFYVVEYKKPEYKVDVLADKENYFKDETAKFKIIGEYYYGARMKDSKLTYNVLSTDYFFNKHTDKYYSFSSQENWCYYGCDRGQGFLSNGEGKLNQLGEMEVLVPLTFKDNELSQVVTFEANITDINNQTVSNRISVPVHNSNTYIGIRTQEYVVTPGEDTNVDLITLDINGQIVANKKVNLSLIKHNWKSIRKKGVDGEYYYENELEKEKIDSNITSTNERGIGVGTFNIKNGGSYEIIAEVSDESGRKSKSSTYVWVYSNTYTNFAWTNNNRIDIEKDKMEYKVGDTAKIMIKSPFKGESVKALITIERENILSKKIITIDSNSKVIEIPITQEMLPNAFVSVLISKPRVGETFDELDNKDTGIPAFKIGYTQLIVNKEEKKLDVVVKTDKKKYLPGENMTVEIEVKDFKGNPIKSEISLSVVDMSVLALTGFYKPDLVEIFYYLRGLGVKTSHMLMYMVDRYKPGSKGGGGGDPEERKRMNMKDTAYWNPSIITDENGKAKITFKLPDNLTTWKLLAIANTKNNLFGSGDNEAISSKKVTLRSVKPRFAVVEDEIEIGAIVHNQTDKKQAFNVEIKGKGFGFLDNTKGKRQIALESGEQQKVKFKIKVMPTNKIDFTFKTTGGIEGLDEVVESIPVYPFGINQTVATSGQIDTNVLEKITIPSKEDSSNGHLNITLSPTLASFLPIAMEKMVNYEYLCAEQISSKLLPNLAVKRLEKIGVKIDGGTMENDELQKLITKLYNYQKSDGSFGYWTYSYSLNSPYLTAYILYTLNNAKNLGFTVDSNVLSSTSNYLQTYLRNNKKFLEESVYISYVLSETGKGDKSILNNLYDERKNLPIFSKAQLAMAYMNLKDESTAKKVLSEIYTLGYVDSRGTSFREKDNSQYKYLMNTNSRTTAIVLRAINKIDPQNPLLMNVIKYMLATRQDGAWDTTQTSSETIIGIVEYLEKTKELDANFVVKAVLGEDEIIKQNFNRENIMQSVSKKININNIERGKTLPLLIEKEGLGKLYYDIIMSYFYTPKYIDPIEQGIGVLREIETLDGKPLNIDSGKFNIGEIYKIKLTMTLRQERHFVAVESFLPGGFEGIDLRLKTESQIGLLEQTDTNYNAYEYRKWNSGFDHIEFRDDRVFLYADFLPQGLYEYEYLVKATTPGKFRYRPTKASEMYFPETMGQTEGRYIEIVE